MSTLLVEDTIVATDESLVARIERELKQAEQNVAKLRQAYRALGGEIQGEHDRYYKLPVWRAIYEYVSGMPGKTAALSDVLDALENTKIDLGKYPKRTIKNALKTRHMKDVFRVYVKGNDEVVEVLPHSKSALADRRG